MNLTNHPIKYDFKTCFDEAAKYSKRSEWERKSRPTYKAAQRNNWLSLCTQHMEASNSIIKRLIYAFEFSDKSVYVGLTCNPTERYDGHLNPKRQKQSSVFEYIQKTNLTPEFKILTEFLTIESAILKEKQVVDEYKLNRWNILNKVRTGGLGGNKFKWTKNNCLSDALNYHSKTEWKKNSKGAYESARINKWLNSVTFKVPNKTS